MGGMEYTNYTEEGDWDFRGTDTKQYTHCFHIYPAMMIPQIARELMVRYGVRDGFLFDPYCGTGTSLVEARVANMNAIGTDINPTARMIAKSKTMDYDITKLRGCVTSFVSDIEENLGNIEDYSDLSEPEFVSWERLEDWFPTRSIAEISYALRAIDNEEYEEGRLFLRVALSECIALPLDSIPLRALRAARRLELRRVLV